MKTTLLIIFGTILILILIYGDLKKLTSKKFKPMKRQDIEGFFINTIIAISAFSLILMIASAL